MIQAKSKIAVTTVKTRAVGLPTKKTSGSTNPYSQRILLVSPPGWGKTEWIGSIPDVLYLATQEGHTHIEAFKIVIDAWDYRKDAREPWVDADGNTHMTFLEVLDLLEKPHTFKAIAIDTLDDLVKMLLDFTYGKHKVEHADDIGEYGKGWDIAQNTPFRRALNRLMKSGCGLIFTTHQNVAERNFKKGKQSKKETTLPGGIWRVIFAQCDLILHGVFGAKRKGSRFADRIINTDGTEEMLAKNRGGVLPGQFIVPPKGQWEQFKSFFEDKKNIDKAQKAYDAIYE